MATIPENRNKGEGNSGIPPPGVPGEAVGPAAPRPLGGQTFRTLRIKNFRLLFSGTIISQTGDFLQLTAQGWLVLVLTGSPLSLGIVGFAQAVPRLALAPLVGKLADRFDRRRLLLIAQGGFLLQTLVFAILVTTEVITFAQIVVLTVIWGVLNGINHTARQSLIPNIVPKEDITSAIALHSAAFNLTRALGPAVGGFLVAWLGVAGCLWINAASFAPMFWMLLAMDVPRIERKRGDGDERFRQAIRFVWSEPDVLQGVGLTFFVAYFALGYARLTPAFARDIFGGGPDAFGLLMAAPGIGALASTLTLARFGSARAVPRILPLVTLGLALALGGFAASPSLGIAIVFLVLLGALHLAQRTLASSLVQTRTPDALRGRVTSLFQIDVGLWSLGSLGMGGLAEAAGLRTAVGIGALLCGALAVAALFRAIGRIRK